MKRSKVYIDDAAFEATVANFAKAGGKELNFNATIGDPLLDKRLFSRARYVRRFPQFETLGFVTTLQWLHRAGSGRVHKTVHLGRRIDHVVGPRELSEVLRRRQIRPGTDRSERPIEGGAGEASQLFRRDCAEADRRERTRNSVASGFHRDQPAPQRQLGGTGPPPHLLRRRLARRRAVAELSEKASFDPARLQSVLHSFQQSDGLFERQGIGLLLSRF